MAGNVPSQSDYTNLQQGAPSNPNNDILSNLAAAAGLGLNIAGAATRTGAVGDRTLGYAQERQDQLNNSYQQGMKKRQETQEQQAQAAIEADQAKLITPLTSQLSNARRPLVQSYVDNGDLKGAQSAFEQALHDDRADDRVNFTVSRAGTSNDDKDLNAAIKAAQIRIGLFNDTVKKDPEAAKAAAFQAWAQAQPGDAPPDVSKYALLNKGVAGKSKDELASVLSDAYASAGGPNEVQRLVGMGKPVDPQHAYQTVATNLLGDGARIEQIRQANDGIKEQKQRIDAMLYIRDNKNNTEPAVQQRVQAYRQKLSQAQ